MSKAAGQSVRKTPPSYVNLILSSTRVGNVLRADDEFYDRIGMTKEQFAREFKDNLLQLVEKDQRDEVCQAIVLGNNSLFKCIIHGSTKINSTLMLGYPIEHKEEKGICAMILFDSFVEEVGETLVGKSGNSNNLDCSENDEVFKEIMIRQVASKEPLDDERYRLDKVTGLPNEIQFYDIVKRTMMREPNRKYAIVYTDFNSFGYVNEMYGYLEGNRFLALYATIMKRERNLVKEMTRLSADNFILFIEYDSEDTVAEQIKQLNEEFVDQCYDERKGIKLILSSGIAFLEIGTPIRLAIDNANMARKSVKGKSHMTCGVFDKKMQDRIQWESHVNQCMENALLMKQFCVYYQPKVDLKTEEIVGAEALVRWIVDGKIIPPNQFIPIFEKNGFIEKLDFFVYEEVCKFLRKRLDQNQKVVPISVNVSGVHLSNPYFVQQVKSLVKRYHLPAQLIELELTESVCIENSREAMDTVKQFRQSGFVVSIDDFGSGFSSLNLLKDIETDIIKLDRQFFREGEMHREEQIIISSIVHMAKQLNMKVLSEGVETSAQSEFLKGILCDMAQGFYFAKPMPLENFEKTI
ncbi:putative bifunctional diguanylate cyclase/phosphodiesterase [Anaerosporobacter faecicola]|uniref:putative bifunctional diguanylate cyclase/phosphodiesterase n=1 Tax=Anaerosporobacter faecicola TaxID=2718714 RepID=UPI0014389650|nr:GGDEF domain-containing phosphodiesterase [Anaerosporobacter faecicola]